MHDSNLCLNLFFSLMGLTLGYGAVMNYLLTGNPFNMSGDLPEE